MDNVAAIMSSFAVGIAAAWVLKGRLGWLVTGAPMVLGAGLRDMKMVLVVRSDLALTRNQVAEHCSSAAISCFKQARTDARKELQSWDRQGQTKVVLKVPGEAELLELARTARAAGLVSAGSPYSSPAVLGIGPGPTKLVDQVAGHLKLY